MNENASCPEEITFLDTDTRKTIKGKEKEIGGKGKQRNTIHVVISIKHS